MPSRKKLTAVKKKLSASLLRTDARGRIPAMAAALTKAAAKKNGGRNIFGIGIARKIKGGKLTDQLCVRIYVVQKIRPRSKIPRSARVPKIIDGVPTDVVEMPPARFHMPIPETMPTDCSAHRRGRRRPVYGGISAAHYKVKRTTLGCFCRSTRAEEAGRIYMLSCNHAFANMNHCRKKDPILQPSKGDGRNISKKKRVVGQLARWEPLHLDGSTPNYVDAAIAVVKSRVKVLNEICMIGPLVGVKAATRNMRVRKHGSKTGYTEGIVDDLDADVVMPYGDNDSAKITNHLGIASDGYPNFALPGDSGSVIVARDSGHAIGLHIGGTEDGKYSFASRMTTICRVLEIAIP